MLSQLKNIRGFFNTLQSDPLAFSTYNQLAKNKKKHFQQKVKFDLSFVNTLKIATLISLSFSKTLMVTLVIQHRLVPTLVCFKKLISLSRKKRCLLPCQASTYRLLYLLIQKDLNCILTNLLQKIKKDKKKTIKLLSSLTTFK